MSTKGGARDTRFSKQKRATRIAKERTTEIGVAPRTALQLHGWLRMHLDVEAPSAALTEGATAPFAYLKHAYFEKGACADCVVWANRGGGKTFYAAVATLMDLMFKPGIEVKILGGSLEQSRRVHEHLRKFFERPGLREFVRDKITDRRIRLGNGSIVETLAQSHTSVRGARPQKLRCDEVELFDPEVWQAAQLATRSKVCGGRLVRGAVEALSTMHRPGGLMSAVIADAQAGGERRVFRWSAIDVLAECPEAVRACEGCGLQVECGGRARRGAGHLSVEDALALKGRSDRASWESEMLCLRAMRSDAVFEEFDPALHVGAFEAPLHAEGAQWIAGMDFGFRAPTVIVWAIVDEAGMVRVIDERVESGRLLDTHIAALQGEASGGWPMPRWVAVDPAGLARREQTGMSDVEVMRRAGLVVRAQRSSVDLGIRAIRARLAPASRAAPTLCIHPRCGKLIAALQAYHYPSGDRRTLSPAKDGPDHAVDALRYMIAALDAPGMGRVSVRGYGGFWGENCHIAKR